MTDRSALFLSTNNDYFLGCCVALHSFINTNSWFQGDIVVLDDDLLPEYQEILERNFRRLRLVKPDRELIKRAEVLSREFDGLKQRAKIFYNFHAFTLLDYDRVIKIDADMLFRGDVSRLFLSTSTRLLACPAWPMYVGESRSKLDYSIVDSYHQDAFKYWVNAGIYSIPNNLLNHEVYQALLKFMDVGFWASQTTNHTDQIGINTLFSDCIELLPATYNYLLQYESLIVKGTDLRADDALVWHYVGGHKPWNLRLSGCQNSSPKTALKSRKEWLDCYCDFDMKETKARLLLDAHKCFKNKFA